MSPHVDTNLGLRSVFHYGSNMALLPAVGPPRLALGPSCHRSSAGGGVGEHLLLPPRGPQTEDQKGLCKQHRHYRAICENAPGDLKRLPPIIDCPMKIGYLAQPKLHSAAAHLYNYVKARGGLVADTRYDWLQ